MLTANQRVMIKERKEKGEDLDNERKKYIDYTLRNFIKKQLSTLGDVSDVLDVLPGNQTRAVIDAEHIIGLLKLLEKISSLCLAPIEFDEKGNAYATYRFQLVKNLSSPVEGKDQMIINMKCSFPAKPWEIEFAKKLETPEFKPYARVLTNLFEIDFGMVRYDMDDTETYTHWLSDLANKRGQLPRIDTGKSFLFGAATIPEELQKEVDEEEQSQK